VDTNNPAYSSVAGVLFSKSQTTLIQYPEGKPGVCYTVPDTVTNIGGSAFYASALTSVVIPNSVTSIGNYTFMVCTSLTNITMGSGVISIGAEAFALCFGLTSVTIPNSVASIGAMAFDNCPSLASVTIGNGLTNIGRYAFEYCYDLNAAWFLGNAPSSETNVFAGDTGTVYYLPGAMGWGQALGNLPTAVWNPQVQADASFGVHTNGFAFTITGTTNIPIVVEACTNLAAANWTALLNCTLTNGAIYFSDPQWTNFSNRFYRISAP